MKKSCSTLSRLMLLVMLTSVPYTAQSARIVRPWRSTTAIVKAGENFEVWFDADADQVISNMELMGPYNTVVPTFSIETGDWEYDQLSGNRFDTKIVVTVPVGTPADRYDLVLKTSAGDVRSPGGVKVVTEYKEQYYIMHISDGHLYQHGYDINVLLGKKSAMIDIANIMDVQVIVETGDNMYNVRNHPEREVIYFEGDESNGFNGMADASAATFMVPGDHDAYTANDWPQASVEVNSDFFNDYYGLQSSSFSYGNGRFMMLNNAWEVSTSSAKDHVCQIDEAVAWLEGAGSGGNFFVTAGHCYDKMHEFIDDHSNLNLVLAGDKHHVRTDNPWSFDTGSDEIAYIAGSIRDHFEFNLFRVDNTNGTFQPVPGTTGVAEVLHSGDQLSPATWVPNLSLTYARENDGSVFENTATINNHFDFQVEDAKVRFVMPKGYNYECTGGTIEQQFEGDLFTIVDVTADLSARSTSEIYLRADDLCPEDPEKTDPGLCGCGIPEGSCAASELIVNQGTGDGSYLPLEVATITADPPAEGMEFRAWVVTLGDPSIDDTTATTTTLTLGDTPATIEAAYREIPKVNGAAFISQSVPELTAGSALPVTITMKNTGNTAWTTADGYFLGSQAPESNTTWGINRVDLEEGEVINPGEEKTFSFDIQVPEDNGVYVLQWQMIQEPVQWFGSRSVATSMRIGEEGVYLDDCDQLTGWKSADDLSLETENVQQGAGYIEFSGSGTDEYKKVFSPAYISGSSAATLVLQFWYYTADTSVLGANQVELGSGGKPDQDEYNWSLEGLSPGWNFITLNISDADVIGNPDLDAINWFRLYNHKSASTISRLDGIELIDTEKGSKYGLKVNDGSGDGSYYQGDEVSIESVPAPAGKLFEQWDINTGSSTIEDVYLEKTVLTMAAGHAEVSAIFMTDPNASDGAPGSADRKVRCYPNPATDLYFIDLPTTDVREVVKVTLFNMSGQVALEQSFHQGPGTGRKLIRIPVDHLLPGTYFTEVRTGDAVSSELLVID